MSGAWGRCEELQARGASTCTTNIKRASSDLHSSRGKSTDMTDKLSERVATTLEHVIVLETICFGCRLHHMPSAGSKFDARDAQRRENVCQPEDKNVGTHHSQIHEKAKQKLDDTKASLATSCVGHTTSGCTLTSGGFGRGRPVFFPLTRPKNSPMERMMLGLITTSLEDPWQKYDFQHLACLYRPPAVRFRGVSH